MYEGFAIFFVQSLEIGLKRQSRMLAANMLNLSLDTCSLDINRFCYAILVF
jgi:hypothetical protein